MTPEQIEGIKLRLTERQARKGTLSQEEVELMAALAALEEAQQQIKELQDGNRSACESREIAYRARNEAVITSNQHYKQLVETQQAAERVLKSHYYVEGKLAEAQQTIARQWEETLELQLLKMWDAAGIEEIYKYKHRIKVFKRPGLVSYELFCDLTYRMFQDVYDTANDNHTTAEDAKVSVKVLLAALGEGTKESRTYIEPDEDAVTTEEEAYFVNEDVKQP